MSREITVWADWQPPPSPARMDELRSSLVRGKEVFSFTYDPARLVGNPSRQLDPDLRLFGGPQYLADADRPNFGIFLDSSPDRWGRFLMRRREAAQARIEGRKTFGFITRHSARPDDDLLELWRRIVFSIAVRNTDDHLRNHGFLLSDGGWRLSPAYDLNPDPDGTGLSLNISEDENPLSFDLALEVAPFFRLPPGKAESILAQIRTAVRGWKDRAHHLGISNAEQERMAPAFGATL